MLPGVAIIALMAASRSARAVFLPPPWLAPVAGWDTLGFLQGTALVFLLMAYRGLVESVGFPGSMLGSAALWTIFQIALTAVVAVLASSGTVRRLASGGPHGRPSSGTRDPPRHWPPLDGGEVRPLVRRAEAEGLRSLGLVGANARAAALTGLGVALAALPVVSGLAWFVRRFAPSDMHPVLEALMERPGAAESALLVAGACVVTPVFEEVVFRGFIYASIRDRMGLWAGLMLSAFLFALPHPSPADQIATFALGVAFALAYERTGSLVGPVVAHAAFNAANVAQVLAL
jgi:membrane protease YdiL (CAAX protease family)